ncbi:MAG: hypothetical protein IPL27_04135 [Lewinellaceae bacterium]|nr:hypothetical protein [Lewinellaceae bacterium]
MKEKNKSLFWIFLAFCTFGLYAPAIAQDDLYYDPATDAPAPTVRTNNNSDDSEYREPSNITRRYDNDDEYYNEDDDYAYQYSSRIRRFHRPARVIDYYDPFFVDLYYYDPFFMPGNSIYTYGYNDYWTWRQWRRAQRWNSWYSWGVGPVWSSWGWNSCYSGFNAWNNPWAMNNYYYDPYWTMNGFNPYYGNNNWANNNYYYSNTGNSSGYQPKTYTGVRRHGSTVNTGYARIAESNGALGRLAAKTDGPVLENRGTRGAPKNMEPTRPTAPPTDRTRASEDYGRRADDKTNAPTTRDGRNMDQPESTRPTRETAPRRSEAETTRPTRTETPARRNEAETRPSRTETPTRRSEPETRPSRTEERPRTYDRPSRTEERSRSNDTPARTQESRPSRNDSGSSPRTFDSGSSRSSSPSSSGNSGSSSGGSRSSGGSSGGGSRGRN